MLYVVSLSLISTTYTKAFQGGGKQVEDQTFNHKDNAALKVCESHDGSNTILHVTISNMYQRSQETGRPVRVVRGFELKSKFAPTRGSAST